MVTYSERYVEAASVLHVLLSFECVLAREQLYERMPLVLVYDASLYGTKPSKYSSKLSFGAAMTTS